MNAEQYDLLPQKVKDVLLPFGNLDDTYENCEQCKLALNEIGWTCEYDLSASIFNVVPTQGLFIGDKVTVTKILGSPKEQWFLHQVFGKTGVVNNIEVYQKGFVTGNMSELGVEVTDRLRVGVKLDVPPTKEFPTSIYYIYPCDLTVTKSVFSEDEDD